MAGNKYDLGGEGIDNFGPDSFDLSFKDPKDHRKPIAKIATSFADAARDQMSNPGTLRRILKDALPTGYGKALGIAFDVNDSARKLYDTAARELRPVLPDMKRTVNKLMPKLDKVLPKDISERLKNATKEEERLGGRVKTDEERQNDDIVQSLSDVFRANIDYTARNEAQKAVYAKVRDQIQNDQFRLSHITMRGMSAGINRLVAYQDEVTSRYQKKSLELQYRQLFATREQTAITQALGRDTVEQLKGILHNTYLPDMAKQSFYDREKNTFKQRIIGAAFPGAQEFVGKYMSNLTENLVKHVKSTLGNVVMGARFAADGVANPLTGEAPDASTVVGGTAGHAAATWLSDKITPHARRLLQKHAGIRRLGEMLNYTLSDPYARLNDFAKSGTSKTGFLGGAINLLKGAMPKHTRDDRLGESPILTANEPAVFNMHARRALTDVIPGFLSRIHHELAIIRTGNAGAERMVYNQDRGQFTTLRASANDMSNRLFDKGSLDKVRHSTNMFLDTVDDKGVLSKEAREAIHNQALNETGNATRFDTQKYVQSLKGASPQVQKEVADHFRSKYKLNPDGSVDHRKSDYSALAKSSDFHQFIRSQAPDPHLMAQAYLEAGYGEQLHAAGLARKDGSTDRFNYDKVGDIYSGKTARPSFHDIFSPEAGMARGPMRGSYIPNPPADHAERDASIDELTRTLKDKFENYKPDNTNMDVVVAALREQSVKAEAMKSAVLLEKILDVLENREFAAHNSSAAAMGAGPTAVGGAATTAAAKGGRWGSKLFSRFRKGQKAENLKSVASGAGTAIGGAVGLGVSAARGIGSGLGSYYQGLGHLVGSTARLAGRITGGLWHRLNPKFKDVYVKGDKKPSLYAKKIEAGDYLNASDGSAIHSLDDIKGPVLDADGNYVLTQDDFVKGLTDVHGKGILGKVAGLAGFLGRGLGAAFGLQFKGIGAIARLAGRAIGAIGGGLYKRATKRIPMDVYVGNERTPRLLALGMKKGEYHLLNDPTKLVMCPADIAGPVMGKDGNVLIREDELDQLRTPHGILRKTAGLAGRALGGILRAQLGVVKFAGRAVAGVGRGVMGFLSHGVKGIFPGHVGKKSKDPVDILLSSLSTQRAIFKLIHERLPKPDHLRAGSWEERFLKKGHDHTTGLPNPASKAGDGSGRMASIMGWLKNKFHRKPKGGLVNDAENKIENVAEGAAGGVVMRGVKALGRGLGRAGTWAKNLVRGGGGEVAEDVGATAAEDIGATAAAGAGETAAVGLGETAAAGLGETAVAAGLGDAALGLGAAALGVLSAPVLLAAGAVAAVGIGAWYAYKWFKNRGPHPLLAARMAQYGVNPKDSDQAKKVANLENTLAEHVSYGSDGASIDAKSLTLKKLVTDFGVNLADTKAVREWLNWYQYRFKVVFLTNMAALHKIDPKATLANVDKDLAPEKKLAFLNAIHVNASHYKVTYNPFGTDSSVVVGEGPVTEAFKAAADEIAKETKKDSKSSPGWFSKTLTNIGNGIRSAAAGFLSAIGLSSLANKVAPKDDKKKPQEVATAQAKALMAKAGAVGASTTKIAGNVTPVTKIGGTSLTALQSVRYKTYGLVEMSGEYVKALFTLETDMMDKITFTAKGQATFDDDPSVYYDTYCSMFGLTTNDVVAKKDWVNWFISRFMPTLLQYATAVRLANPNINVLDADRALKPDQQLDVAKSTMDAKAEISMGKLSVWSVSISPWPNYKLNMDSKSVQPNLDYLKSLVDKMVFDEKTATAKANAAGKPTTTADGSAKPGATAPKTAGGATAAGAQAKKTNTPTSIQAQSVGNQPSSNGDYTTSAGEGGAGSFGKGTPGGGNGAPGKSMGTMIPEPGNGTGGDINKIPMPGPGRGWAAAGPTIEAAAKMAGMDPKLLGTIASIESGFNASVKAGSSSATGYFQFVSGTWRSMLNKYGKKYGISPDTSPSDPRANALMGAEYTRENQEYLERRLGRKVTDTELYLAHFLGAGGAYNLLKAPADANAAAAFPSAARANPAIFKDGGRDRTVQEVIALMDHKVKSHSVSVGGAAPSKGTSSAMKASTGGGITGLPKGNGMASSAASAGSSTVAPTKGSGSSPAMGGGGVKRPGGSAMTNTPVPTIDRSMSLGSGSSDTTDADTVETRRSQAMQTAAAADDQQRKAITTDNTKSADVATLLTQGLQTWMSMDGTLKLMLKAMGSGTPPGSNSPSQANPASSSADTSPAAVGVSPSSSSKGPAQMAAQAPVDVSRKTG